MTKRKSIHYSKLFLSIISFIAIVFNAQLYLSASRYIIANQHSHALLETLSWIPNSPKRVFLMSVGLYLILLAVMYYSDHYRIEKPSLFDGWSLLKIILTFVIIYYTQFSYNGLILLVFSDIFYSSKEINSFTSKRSWFIFVMLSFAILLISNNDIVSLFLKLPSLDAYIQFYPQTVQFAILVAKNVLSSLNMVIFIISLLFYIMYATTERNHIEEELAMASKVNSDLNDYVALTEKIVEDRERKRIAREIHDTLGHALTGISAGIDAVKVLVDLDTAKAKAQLESMSLVVRDGIRDVRGSLNKLRPGALEDGSLKEALEKMIAEYQAVSHLKIQLDYQWDGVDLDTMKEDLVFRVIQESITNSLRHGHASHISIALKQSDTDYLLELQDDGVGFETLHYGYGLWQMRERLAIVGGEVSFENRQGFYTNIHLPKRIGESDEDTNR
ncbi:sensor histidine kinase [Streptococcus sp. zg-JUN1979]|uniref:sensor histidine kinase n=1 Tax=Streptococcus sp. zg-JUN1979 TaxID=3391450 RepID=UPI0039AE987F